MSLWNNPEKPFFFSNKKKFLQNSPFLYSLFMLMVCIFVQIDIQYSIGWINKINGKKNTVHNPHTKKNILVLFLSMETKAQWFVNINKL